MTAKILVTLAGLGLIVFVNWYFFPRSRKKA
jgi:plastocyanin domain-containing protein